MLYYCYWLILTKKATTKPSEKRGKRSNLEIHNCSNTVPLRGQSWPCWICPINLCSLFSCWQVGVLMLPITWVVQRDSNPVALFLRVTSISFYPHLIENGRSVLKIDAVYWPCKERGASLVRLHFLPFPILNNRNIGTWQYWCGACEAFCSQQASCSLQILCSPHFVWCSCWGKWLRGGQPLNLSTSNCGFHHRIALPGICCLFIMSF